MPKKLASNINLLYNNNNVYSALLNIIIELKRALRILLETIANYHKDNIINLHIHSQQKCQVYVTCISSIEVNISNGQYSSVETSKLPTVSKIWE